MVARLVLLVTQMSVLTALFVLLRTLAPRVQLFRPHREPAMLVLVLAMRLVSGVTLLTS